MLKEHEVQKLLFEWMSHVPQCKNAFAIPNAQLLLSKLPSTRQRFAALNYLAQEGVKKGIADIFLPYPVGTYHGMFIELKREKGGVVSKEQKEFLQNMELVGYYAVVARGFDDAKEKIEGYIKST